MLFAILILVGFAGSVRAAAPASPQIERLLADHHYLRAQAPIQAILARDSNDASALIELSVDEWAFSHFDAAIAAAERAVAAAPSRAGAYAQLANAVGAKLAASSAGTFEKLSLVHQFRNAAGRALELDPNDLEALQDLARFYWSAPGFAGGDKAKAQQMADHLFKLSPYLGAAARDNFISGRSNPTSGDIAPYPPKPQDAQATAALYAIWRAALAAAPQSYRSHAALAATALQAAAPDLSLARAEAEEARALDPSRVMAYKTLAVVAVLSADWAALASTIEQSDSHVPDDRTPEYLAATAILTTGAKSEYLLAERYLRDYLAHPAEGHEPSPAEAHWRLGLVLEREGRRAEAIQELRAAVALDPSLAIADLKRLS